MTRKDGLKKVYIIAGKCYDPKVREYLMSVHNQLQKGLTKILYFEDVDLQDYPVFISGADLDPGKMAQIFMPIPEEEESSQFSEFIDGLPFKVPQDIKSKLESYNRGHELIDDLYLNKRLWYSKTLPNFDISKVD